MGGELGWVGGRVTDALARGDFFGGGSGDAYGNMRAVPGFPLHLDAVQLGVLLEQSQIHLAIGRREENVAPLIAALRDVMRTLRDHNPCESRHIVGVSRQSRTSQRIREISVCPGFPSIVPTARRGLMASGGS